MNPLSEDFDHIITTIYAKPVMDDPYVKFLKMFRSVDFDIIFRCVKERSCLIAN